MLLFVDNLTNVDFSYLHPKRGLIGETWLASIEMEGSLDEQGMVCDFGIVKKKLRDWLDDVIDHRLLVPSKADNLKLNTDENSYDIQWETTAGKLHCQSPLSAITLIDETNIDETTVAQWCINQLMPQFPSTVKQLKISFKPESIPTPYYHYSHGLKKHAGNCQRIAHGHRSKIEIWRNGKLSLEDMQNWATKWKDIYIGTEQDLAKEQPHENSHCFEYTAQQGEFSLTINKEQCYLIDTDSTVELIAKHIANQLAEKHPGNHFTVKAYEGTGKGAIAKSE